MDTNYSLFIDELIKRRNFPDLTPEVREELKKDVMERLDSYILDRIIDLLSEEDSEQFVEMMKEKKSIEELQQFVKGHIDNYESFMKETFADFASSYLSNESIESEE